LHKGQGLGKVRGNWSWWLKIAGSGSGCKGLECEAAIVIGRILKQKLQNKNLTKTDVTFDVYTNTQTNTQTNTHPIVPFAVFLPWFYPTKLFMKSKYEFVNSDPGKRYLKQVGGASSDVRIDI